MTNYNRGFTLLELSIVITIIGLIIGGIIVGRSVIRNAELQSVISDVNRFKNAIKLFKDKYHDLPGNKPDGVAFWGVDSACPAVANLVPKAATCPGSGNGFIGGSTGTPLAIGSNYYESLRAWQQLANAGFIEGQYSGADGTSTHYVPGINIPTSKIKQSGYTLSYAAPTGMNGTAGAVAGVFGANYRHIIVFGITTGLGLTQPANIAGLQADDAQSIDQKIDDAQPGTGNVLTYTNNAASPTPSCASSAVESSAMYSTSAGLLCSLIFITGF
jgi:prepilin-type N-terminal cleavage/methylation domain-containing protein